MGHLAELLLYLCRWEIPFFPTFSICCDIIGAQISLPLRLSIYFCWIWKADGSPPMAYYLNAVEGISTIHHNRHFWTFIEYVWQTCVVVIPGGFSRCSRNNITALFNFTLEPISPNLPYLRRPLNNVSWVSTELCTPSCWPPSYRKNIVEKGVKQKSNTLT